MMDISVRITRNENAEYFGVYYLDILNAPFTAYRGDDNVHLTTLGYMLLGQTVYERLNAFIANNLTDFVNLYIPQTLGNVYTTKVDAD